MPVYSYTCSRHGKMEVFQHMTERKPVCCPDCGAPMSQVFTVPAVKVVNKPRLEYGSGSPGKIILGKETGGLDIFVASDGALEQDEVDYIAEGAIEKERARVKKKGFQRENQARIAAYANLAMSAKRGQRAKTLRKVIAESGDKIRV